MFGAVIFTAIAIGQASSFAPGTSKAQVSAAKIIALLNRKPQIDASSSEGIKPVSIGSRYIQVLIHNCDVLILLVIPGKAQWRHCC